MSRPVTMSRQTRVNFLIFATVFAAAVIAALSGIYFLFFPVGRDALDVLITRTDWENLHLIGGLLMSAVAVVHFVIHWKWVKTTARRIFLSIRTRQGSFSRGAKQNIVIDVVVAVSFLVAALTGIYFLFVVDGGYQGGRNLGWDPGFLFSRTTWDLLHTWSGVILIIAAVPHFYIHWGWIKKVTARFFLSMVPNRAQPQPQPHVH